MQGVILSAHPRHLILGDDGSRYNFTLERWRSDTIDPEAGMRVNFEVEGSRAVDVRPIFDTDTAPAPGSPSSQSATSTHVPPASGTSSSPQGIRPSATTHRGKSKSAVALLFIFLGPLGYLIAVFYIGPRGGWWVSNFLYALLSVVIFPIGLLLWPMLIIVGIILFFISEDRWNYTVHKHRDHAGFNRDKCLTRECHNTLESWLIRTTRGVNAAAREYGGRRTKSCPYCGATIPYISLRCHNCKADLFAYESETSRLDQL